MTEANQPELDPKMSETDLAYHILQQSACPQHYLDLINRILEIKDPNMVGQVRAIAAVYTQINLDTRFSHFGEGQWGLKAWMPGRAARRVPLLALLHKAQAQDDEPRSKGKERLTALEPGLNTLPADSFDCFAEGSDEEEWEE